MRMLGVRVCLVVLALIVKISGLLMVVRCLCVVVRCFKMCLFRHGVILFVEGCSRRWDAELTPNVIHAAPSFTDT